MENENVEFVCLMIDIDYFKCVNDEYGYVKGDVVLVGVVVFLRKIFCEMDLICCYGGEEFCVVLFN